MTEDEIIDVLQMQTGIPKAYFDEYFVDKKAAIRILKNDSENIL